MSQDPDQIRDDIEATRSELSDDVNALADRAKPTNVAKRQAEKVTDTLGSVKDRVMGASNGAASSTGSAVSDAVGSAKDAATSVPSRTRGNPVAAGLIAFGAGWLLGSLLPATSIEQQAAETVKDKAAPLADQVKEAAKDVASGMQEPAQQAVEDLKSSATESVQTVKGEAQSTAADLKSSSQDAVSEVRQSGS